MLLIKQLPVNHQSPVLRSTKWKLWHSCHLQRIHRPIIRYFKIIVKQGFSTCLHFKSKVGLIFLLNICYDFVSIIATRNKVRKDKCKRISGN